MRQKNLTVKQKKILESPPLKRRQITQQKKEGCRSFVFWHNFSHGKFKANKEKYLEILCLYMKTLHLRFSSTVRL